MAVERVNPLFGEAGTYEDNTQEEPLEVVLEGEEPEEEAAPQEPEDHSANLAEYWPEDVVQSFGKKVKEAYEDDLSSRKGLEDQIVMGLTELGLKMEDGTEPFYGACMATHPLLLENVVKVQSKAVQEMFPAAGPVKTRIFGAITPEKEAQANRIKEFMNYQIMEEMVEFVDESERMLFSWGFLGTAIKKTYWDSGLERPTSEFVPFQDFVIAYNAPDLRRASRFTHVIFRNKDEFDSDVQSGVYKDPGPCTPVQPEISEIQRKMDELQGIATPASYEGYTILEHHCYWKGPGDEYVSPYIVAVLKENDAVLSIRRNWDPQDPKRKRLDWFTRYLFVPSTGFYGFGLLQLIGSLAKTATETMRSLVDAGQFANMQGGFKLRNLRIVGNSQNGAISPGEWRDVDSPNMDLRQALLPIPYKEPSQTLYTLLEYVVGAGQKFADTTEQVISDSTNYGPVGTTMALLEASTKFFSALHKRLHGAFKNELRILKRLNANQLPDSYPYPVEGAEASIKRQDFTDSIDIVPASDPNTPSNAHRVTKATTVLQMAMQNPQFHDIREIYRRTYMAMEVEGIEKIMPPPQQPQPMDPISDIMTASKGGPIAAFPGQDHDAHIQVKMAFLSDPGAGGSPAFKPVVPNIAANIREHMVMKYQEMAQAMGGDQAQAAQEVAKQGALQAQAQAQQLMGGGDPSIALGYAELQQREKEHQSKTIVDVAKLALEDRKLDIQELQAEAQGVVQGLQLNQKEVSDKRQVGTKLVGEATKLVIAKEKAAAQKAAAKARPKGGSNAK